MCVECCWWPHRESAHWGREGEIVNFHDNWHRNDSQADTEKRVWCLDAVLLMLLCLLALTSTILLVATRSIWPMAPTALAVSLWMVLRAPRLG